MTKTEAVWNKLDPERWGVLLQAHEDVHAAISPAYDEVLTEVAARIRNAGSIGKLDIGALLSWKRLRADTKWVRELMLMSDSDVRRITGPAATAVNDNTLDVPNAAAQGRAALSHLPGFARGDALASAVLTAAAPKRMAVYDRRSQSGLEKLGVTLSSSRGRYGRYMKILEDLSTAAHCHGHDWSAREIDLALYWLGRQS